MRMRHAAVVAGLAFGLMSGSAQAAYVVNIYQDGNNVVASGSGSLNLDDATELGQAYSGGFLANSAFQVGSGIRVFYSAYFFLFPDITYRSGPFVLANFSTGPVVGFDNASELLSVPAGYQSGQKLGISTSIYYGQTIDSLNLIPGQYTDYFRINEIPGYDTFTLKIGVSPMPLPASAPMFGAALLGLAGLGYAAKRKKAAATA